VDADEIQKLVLEARVLKARLDDGDLNIPALKRFLTKVTELEPAPAAVPDTTYNSFFLKHMRDDARKAKQARKSNGKP
jgi:hypothetical protein